MIIKTLDIKQFRWIPSESRLLAFGRYIDLWDDFDKQLEPNKTQIAINSKSCTEHFLFDHREFTDNELVAWHFTPINDKCKVKKLMIIYGEDPRI